VRMDGARMSTRTTEIALEPDDNPEGSGREQASRTPLLKNQWARDVLETRRVILTDTTAPQFKRVVVAH